MSICLPSVMVDSEIVYWFYILLFFLWFFTFPLFKLVITTRYAYKWRVLSHFVASLENFLCMGYHSGSIRANHIMMHNLIGYYHCHIPGRDETKTPYVWSDPSLCSGGIEGWGGWAINAVGFWVWLYCRRSLDGQTWEFLHVWVEGRK